MSKIVTFPERPYDPVQLHRALASAGYLVETVYSDSRVQLADGETKDPMLVILDNIPPPPHVPTPGELAVIAIEAETAAANDNALAAYQVWGNLTLAQKDRVLKGLLGDFISRHRGNYL